jgi:hypothetical protein
MPRPVTGLGFRGMNNLEIAPGIFLDDAKRITPRIALNCEVTDGGKLIRRKGYKLHVSLPGVRSLWSGSVMLCVCNDTLYRIEALTAIPVTSLTDPGTPLCYNELDNLIFMSNGPWSGVYDIIKGTVRPWGLSLPPIPAVSLMDGDLPPGAYSLALTRSEDGRLSGNGPVAQVSWSGGSRGMSVSNIPTGGQVWMTHPNGTDLFLADRVGGVILGPTVVPLPSFTAGPPPGFTHFNYAFGRIWGCSGKVLAYSDSFQYEWFRESTYKPFLEELIMVAPVADGLFVNSRESTWFLDGTDPAKMVLKRVGQGAVPGTLVYADMPGAVVGGGYEMSRRLSQIPSPIWVGPHGYVVGTQTGHLVHLTQSRLRMPVRTKGSSVFRDKGGAPQVITVMSGPLLNDESETLETVFEDGKLFD